jgi:sugar-specific transcriptional regulator TrmB
MNSAESNLSSIFERVLEVTEGDGRSAAKLYLTLLRLKVAPAKKLAEESGVSYPSATTLLEELAEKWKLISRQKLTKQAALYQYEMPRDWKDRMRLTVERYKSRLDDQYDVFLEDASSVGEPMPPVVFNVLAYGAKISSDEYELAIAHTIDLFRSAQKSIAIMTRDFTWIDRALNVLRSRLSDGVDVKLLINWEDTPAEEQGKIRELSKLGLQVGSYRRWPV